MAESVRQAPPECWLGLGGFGVLRGLCRGLWRSRLCGFGFLLRSELLLDLEADGVHRRIHLRNSWAVFREMGIRILMDIVSSNDCGAVAIFRRLDALTPRVQYFLTMAILLKSAFAIVSRYGRFAP